MTSRIANSVLRTCARCAQLRLQSARPLTTTAWQTGSLRSPSSFSPYRTTGPSIFRRSLTVTAQLPKEPPDEPLKGEPVMTLTDTAIAQIKRVQDKAKNAELALRVAVQSGGCHGYQYIMEVTDKREDDDYLFAPTDTSARLVIDSASFTLLSGSTIDYATELIGSSFRVKANPHANDKAGCGCGVSWDLQE